MNEVKLSKAEVHELLLGAHMIPVFNHTDPEVVYQTIAACYAGGCRVFEYTNRGEGAGAVLEQIIDRVQNDFPDLLLGVGSIFEVSEAITYAGLGADFIVQPVLNPDVAEWCAEQDIYWIPGTGSTTEVWEASRLGAGIIKVFPGGVLGADFIKAVRGPLPQVQLMPTGGVTPDPENLKMWFDAGVVCVGMGSQLLTKDLINSADYASLQTRVSDTLSWITSYRKQR